MIAQNAIGKPAFQRKCFSLIRKAVRSGDILARYEALLTDRIRFYERRPQVYVTIFDWDENGEMSPWKIERPGTVDARRAKVGLKPLTERIREIREKVREEGAVQPISYPERQNEVVEWARIVGWL